MVANFVRMLMMVEFLQTSGAQLVIGTASLMVMSVIGFYIVQRFRDVAKSPETTDDLLSKFRDLRQQGNLEEKEFRSIKTVLAARMQAKARREEETN